MESHTKVKLSHETIEALVKHAFGDIPVSSVREMTDGYFNTAYHITANAGMMHTVLKVGPPPGTDVLTYETDLLRAEVDTMKLAATDPGIPVPRITFDDFSRTRLPYEYYFMDFLEGTPWNKIQATLSDAQNHLIEHQLGCITAQLNKFEHPSFGYYAFGPEFENWPDAFRWMCEVLFADAQRFHMTLDLSEAEFFDKFEEYREVFAEVTRPQLVHWDLWAGNIFIRLDGDVPTISGIIDFERALWGDPLMEAYHGKLKDIPHYISGYGTNIFATHAQRIRRIFYNLYLFMILIIEDGPRQYTDKGSVEWGARQLQRTLEMLRHGDVIPDA